MEKEAPEALSTCKLTCGPDANLFPRPQQVAVHKRLQAINFNSMSIEFQDSNGDVDMKRS